MRIHLTSIFLAVLLLMTFSVNAVAQYELFISTIVIYEQGRITISETKLIQTTEPLSKVEDNGDYTLKLFSFKNEVLYETKFNLNFFLYNEPLKEWFDK